MKTVSAMNYSEFANMNMATKQSSYTSMVASAFFEKGGWMND